MMCCQVVYGVSNEGDHSKGMHKARKLEDKSKKVTSCRHFGQAGATDENNVKIIGKVHQCGPILDKEESEEIHSYDEEDCKRHALDYQLIIFTWAHLEGSLSTSIRSSFVCHETSKMTNYVVFDVKVHGGVPVSVLATNLGTYWNSLGDSSDDNEPMNPYENARPDDIASEATTPTHHRNYPPSSDGLLCTGPHDKPTIRTADDVVQDERPDNKTNASSPGDAMPLKPPCNGPCSNASALDMNGVFSQDLVRPTSPLRGLLSPICEGDITSDAKLGIGRHTSEDGRDSRKHGKEHTVGIVREPPELDPPGSLDAIVYAPNAIAQCQGLRECVENSLKACTDEGKFPRRVAASSNLEEILPWIKIVGFVVSRGNCRQKRNIQAKVTNVGVRMSPIQIFSLQGDNVVNLMPIKRLPAENKAGNLCFCSLRGINHQGQGNGCTARCETRRPDQNLARDWWLRRDACKILEQTEENTCHEIVFNVHAPNRHMLHQVVLPHATSELC
ncbi:hypothetical protein GOP47_0019374 [Adiantum capillus-veneris]|uniref:Uncharacterized protein n=1 Tax=Adiantum capillus-veneris TaxID=13818 RepID=A0A9D4UCG7_ADICA|nr:hypothetical protein GOP47_0019374 [Adiantum capillus-veneris]